MSCSRTPKPLSHGYPTRRAFWGRSCLASAVNWCRGYSAAWYAVAAAFSPLSLLRSPVHCGVIAPGNHCDLQSLRCSRGASLGTGEALGCGAIPRTPGRENEYRCAGVGFGRTLALGVIPPLRQVQKIRHSKFSGSKTAGEAAKAWLLPLLI